MLLLLLLLVRLVLVVKESNEGENEVTREENQLDRKP